MNEFEWTYFVLGVIVYQLIKMFYLVLDQKLRERREKRILKMVSIEIPDHKNITIITLDTSDKRAMAKLERELRERFNLDEDLEEGTQVTYRRGHSDRS
jgi:hypothetical protein